MKIEWDFKELYNFADKLGNVNNFKHYVKLAADDIAKDLQEMLKKNTPYKTGKLQQGWLSGGYVIVEKGKGYEVTLLNDVEYAYYVNYGHYSYNQFNKGGEPYFVYNRTPKIAPEFETNDDDTFVFGHFFVEKTLVDYAESFKLDKLLFTQLNKWWEGCF